MEAKNARSLFNKYSSAMAYVAVEMPDGTEGIGTAFHVGEGVFVTAKHVVEGNCILEVNNSTFLRTSVLKVVKGPFYSDDADVDIAVFKVSGITPDIPSIPLGDHLDDWIGLDDFVLSEVVILGYPPVPFAREPHLIAARGEVNAQLGLRHAKHVHFIVSATPRGGFSGGVVISEWGFALGVITQSLVMNNLPEQMGYMAVLSIEPIYSCLAANKLLPKVQTEGWDDFWNSDTTWFAKEAADASRLSASIEICDDGRKLIFAVLCDVPEDRQRAIERVKASLIGFEYQQAVVEQTVRFDISLKEGASEGLLNALEAAKKSLLDSGYLLADDFIHSGSDECPF